MATEAQLERAFRTGVASIADPVNASALRRALENGDIEQAIAVLNIEPEAFDELRLLITETYASAGADELSGRRFAGQVVRWNTANPRAETYARNVVGEKIQFITDDTILAVRNTIADGYVFGRTPARMALDIVGRVGADGHRTGGMVGLNAPQGKWVDNMRSALSGQLEGRFWIGADGRLKSTFGNRDRRHDALILKSLRDGVPLTQKQIDNILRTYTNRLLLLRGKTIARTERGAAVNGGRMEAWRQAADKLGVPHSRIKKTWVYTNRSREDRPNHRAANKEVVQGLDTPFSTGLMYPHDPAGLPGQVINCSCEVKMGF